MKKMKKLIAFVLVAAMVLALAACGKKDADTTPTPSAGDSLAGTYTITVWAAEKAVDLTKKQITDFNNNNEFGIKFEATVNPVGEGDAASSMTQSVEDGADLFFFPDDQLGRLIEAGALAKLGVKAAETVKANNTEGSVKAVTAGTALYGYPATSDNGFFLYYDKSVLTAEDVKSLNTMITKCEAADKNIAFNLTDNGWYLAAFFFATGCDSQWVSNSAGKTTSVTDTFNTPEGLIAAKGVKALMSSAKYVNASSAATAFSNGAAAVVSGVWDAVAAKEALGDNLAAAELPSFTIDGKSYHLGSFSGYKLIGVKPQADDKKAAALSQLALYLTSESAEIERFKELEWGPSNAKALASEEVQKNAALAALGAQSTYAKTQGAIGGGWWDCAKALGAGIFEAKSDADLQKALDTYSAKIDEILNQSDEVANAFTVIGVGGDWETDHVMIQDGDVWTSQEAFDFAAGAEFKCRQGKKWDVNYGKPGTGDNFVVETAGTYYVVLDASTGTITLKAK